MAAGPALSEHLSALGARTSALGAPLNDEQGVVAAVAAASPADVLVVDAAEGFTAAGAGHEGLRACVDGAWNVVRAVADAQLVDRQKPSAGRGGRIVLLAPAPAAGLHAEAARGALENLARTLSTEWSRYAITTIAILPGDATTPGELHELVAFVASPAGSYYTGCAFTMGLSEPA